MLTLLFYMGLISVIIMGEKGVFDKKKDGGFYVIPFCFLGILYIIGCQYVCFMMNPTDAKSILKKLDESVSAKPDCGFKI